MTGFRLSDQRNTSNSSNDDSLMDRMQSEEMSGSGGKNTILMMKRSHINQEEGLRLYDFCHKLMLEIRQAKAKGPTNGYDDDVIECLMSDIEQQSDFLFSEDSGSCEVERIGELVPRIKIKNDPEEGPDMAEA